MESTWYFVCDIRTWLGPDCNGRRGCTTYHWTECLRLDTSDGWSQGWTRRQTAYSWWTCAGLLVQTYFIEHKMDALEGTVFLLHHHSRTKLSCSIFHSEFVIALNYTYPPQSTMWIKVWQNHKRLLYACWLVPSTKLPLNKPLITAEQIPCKVYIGDWWCVIMWRYIFFGDELLAQSDMFIELVRWQFTLNVNAFKELKLWQVAMLKTLEPSMDLRSWFQISRTALKSTE